MATLGQSWLELALRLWPASWSEGLLVLTGSLFRVWTIAVRNWVGSASRHGTVTDLSAKETEPRLEQHTLAAGNARRTDDPGARLIFRLNVRIVPERRSPFFRFYEVTQRRAENYYGGTPSRNSDQCVWMMR